MSKIGDITTLALVIGGGYLILKNWAGIKDFFGGLTGIVGGAGETVVGGGETVVENIEDIVGGQDVPIVDEEGTQVDTAEIPGFIDLITGGTIEPEPIPEESIIPDPDAQPPGFWELINPFVRPPPSYTYTPPAPPIEYTPSPIQIQPDPIVFPADPGHPATDPFLGGR